MSLSSSGREPAPGSFSRRRFLRTGAAAALSTVLPAAPAGAAPEGFTFVVLTDFHYRDERCAAWAERVLASLRALRPRPAFLMLAGDLSEDGTSAQLGAMRELFTPLPFPVRALIGNHDYTLEGRRAPWEQHFGRELNGRFHAGGAQFLVLDTTAGRNVYRTKIAPASLDWLHAQLPTLSRDQPLILLTHFPLGRNWLRPLNARAVTEPLRPFPFRAVLAGHWHGWTERHEGPTALSTGRCCSWWRHNHDGSPEKGYTLCTVAAGEVHRTFVAVA